MRLEISEKIAEALLAEYALYTDNIQNTSYGFDSISIFA